MATNTRHQGTIIMDLDGTITRSAVGEYSEHLPDLEVVEQMRQYSKMGFSIAIYTARNMKTHENSIGKINAKTLPVIIAWLEKHNIPFDELHIGKPWCGVSGFYVDDKAIRPSEFKNLNHEQILSLISKESAA